MGGGTIDFCSSQGHMTSKEAKPVLASKCDLPLQRPCDLEFDKCMNRFKLQDLMSQNKSLELKTIVPP